jgi:hypothetical protein
MKTIIRSVSSLERKALSALALLNELPAPVLRLPVISHAEVLHILHCEFPAQCENCIRRNAR